MSKALLYDAALCIGVLHQLAAAAAFRMQSDPGTRNPGTGRRGRHCSDILPRIFDPFLAKKKPGQSVGLGLAVSQTIVERHGGRMEPASEVGRGTTFTVTLPAATPALANLGSAAKVDQVKSR